MILRSEGCDYFLTKLAYMIGQARVSKMTVCTATTSLTDQVYLLG